MCVCVCASVCVGVCEGERERRLTSSRKKDMSERWCTDVSNFTTEILYIPFPGIIVVVCYRCCVLTSMFPVLSVCEVLNSPDTARDGRRQWIFA